MLLVIILSLVSVVKCVIVRHRVWVYSAGNYLNFNISLTKWQQNGVRGMIWFTVSTLFPPNLVFVTALPCKTLIAT